MQPLRIIVHSSSKNTGRPSGPSQKRKQSFNFSNEREKYYAKRMQKNGRQKSDLQKNCFQIFVCLELQAWTLRTRTLRDCKADCPCVIV